MCHASAKGQPCAFDRNDDGSELPLPDHLYLFPGQQAQACQAALHCPAACDRGYVNCSANPCQGQWLGLVCRLAMPGFSFLIFGGNCWADG